jgi:hypothetical protein
MLDVDRHGDQYVLREPHEDEAKILPEFSKEPLGSL